MRWSQQRLSEATGIQAVRLSKIENGHVSASLAEAVRLARGLKASIDDLVFGPSRSSIERQGLGLRAQVQALEAVGAADELEIVAELLRKLIAGRRAASSTRPKR